MRGTFNVVMGDAGRLVIPAEVRRSAGLDAGTKLVLFAGDNGLVLLTHEHLRARVEQDLSGLDLVDDLLAERRRAAADESGVRQIR